jgi:hypothetical protein
MTEEEEGSVGIRINKRGPAPASNGAVEEGAGAIRIGADPIVVVFILAVEAEAEAATVLDLRRDLVGCGI